jgi:hypothetical protein
MPSDPRDSVYDAYTDSASNSNVMILLRVKNPIEAHQKISFFIMFNNFFFHFLPRFFFFLGVFSINPTNFSPS